MNGIATRVRTHYRVMGPTLVVNLGGQKRVLSSAPQGGGFTLASYILNHQVDADSTATVTPSQCFPDPARFLRRMAAQLGIRAHTVGLMTAVPMTQLVTARAVCDGLWMECFATVGVTNAVRAGEWPPQHAHCDGSGKPGTINLILITNGSLSLGAMVGVVQVATEAKTGVLRDHRVRSCHRGKAATGTGTDAVVIACRLSRAGIPCQYSGTHTILGALVGRVVTHCIVRGLAKAKAWRESHS